MKRLLLVVLPLCLSLIALWFAFHPRERLRPMPPSLTDRRTTADLVLLKSAAYRQMSTKKAWTGASVRDLMGDAQRIVISETGDVTRYKSATTATTADVDVYTPPSLEERLTALEKRMDVADRDLYNLAIDIKPGHRYTGILRLVPEASVTR